MAFVSTRKGRISEKLSSYIDTDNIAPTLSDQKLTEISEEVIESVQEDDDSRNKWNQQVTEAFKLSSQIIETKNTPWPGAANVKYPLIMTGAMQFNARTLPEIIKGNKVVSGRVMLPKPTTQEEDRATRMGDHMSYQLLHGIPNWYRDTDRLLMSLSITGMMFRKIYYNPILRRPQIDLCMPADIVINNSVDSLETAPRITHILRLSTNNIISHMRAGLYKEYSLEDLNINPDDPEPEEKTITNRTAMIDELMPMDNIHEIYEQHTEIDLDDDGYKEPYVITLHKKSQKVLRIVARYDEESFIWNKTTGKFVLIEPIQYFVDYPFLPAPDCTYYSVGFGHYLYPLNKVLNSLLNQLLDAGTLVNRGGGFIAKSLRMRRRDVKYKIGEFTSVEVPTGTTIRDNIYPMPVNEPSMALFNLFSLLLKAAQELSSTSDILQGQSPDPNTPATTVVAMIEQGTKIYSAMLTRLYTSFRKEFQLLYNLNKKYLDQYETYQYAEMTGEIKLEDYQLPEYGVIPVADPTMSSDASRLARAQALLQLMNHPMINQEEVLQRYIEALNVPHPEKIITEPPPPSPSPEEIKAEAESGLMGAKTEYTKAQIHDLLMQRELEAIKIDQDGRLKEKELQVYAATQAAHVTKQKIDSAIELAQADHSLGEKSVEMAEKQEKAFEPPPIDTNPLGEVSEKITGIEDILTQTLGISAGDQVPTQPNNANKNIISSEVTPAEAVQGQAPIPPPEPGAPDTEADVGTKIPLPKTKAITSATEAEQT